MDHLVEEWAPTHTRWSELAQAIADQQQTHWALEPYFEPFDRHFLAALKDDKVVGFIMFVVWEIGPHDRSHPPIQLNGETLTEAKIIAFGVSEAYRRQGIGRALQEQTLVRAKALGCYQVRSVSDGRHPENHRLKLSMGFAVEPMEREEASLAFVMPVH